MTGLIRQIMHDPWIVTIFCKMLGGSVEIGLALMC